jgi:hypothetical protein
MGIKVFLDDIRTPCMVYGSGADAEWKTVRTAEEVMRLLETEIVSHLSLDNDLGEGMTEGFRVVRWMIEHDIWPTDEVYVHSENIVRGPEMRADVARYFHPKKRKGREAL